MGRPVVMILYEDTLHQLIEKGRDLLDERRTVCLYCVTQMDLAYLKPAVNFVCFVRREEELEEALMFFEQVLEFAKLEVCDANAVEEVVLNRLSLEQVVMRLREINAVLEGRVRRDVLYNRRDVRSVVVIGADATVSFQFDRKGVLHEVNLIDEVYRLEEHVLREFAQYVEEAFEPEQVIGFEVGFKEEKLSGVLKVEEVFEEEPGCFVVVLED